MASPIERLLAELRVELRHDPLLARRVVEEAADHLAEIAAAERSRGMSEHDAESEAVRRFGPAGLVAGRFERYSPPLRALVAVAAVITVLVAGWLLVVTTWVLPAHDPAHVAMWRRVALAYLAYAGLTFWYLAAGTSMTALRWIVLLASAAAIGMGAFLVANYVASVNSGAHSEGYLLLMGILLAAHGLIVFADGGITAAIAKRMRKG